MKLFVIVGVCPQSENDIPQFVHRHIPNLPENSEVNIFDLPRTCGFDGGGHIDNIYIHRYACPSDNPSDSILRCREILRDIVALGPHLSLLINDVDSHYRPLMDEIHNALKQYGITCSMI